MRGKPHKEAIESLYSIATPKMEEVSYRDEIEADVPDILEKCIEAQIIRFLG